MLPIRVDVITFITFKQDSSMQNKLKQPLCRTTKILKPINQTNKQSNKQSIKQTIKQTINQTNKQTINQTNKQTCFFINSTLITIHDTKNIGQLKRFSRFPLKVPLYFQTHLGSNGCSYVPWSKVAILGMGNLPPLIGNPFNGYINPYGIGLMSLSPIIWK